MATYPQADENLTSVISGREETIANAYVDERAAKVLIFHRTVQKGTSGKPKDLTLS